MDGTFRIKEKQHEGLATFYRRFDITRNFFFFFNISIDSF